jgi:hypothetical protein
MPIYSFENEKGEIWDELMSWEHRCEYLKENPTIKQIITGAPNINKGGTGDRTKPSGGFKDVLSRVAEANPMSPMADDFGKKDAKSVAIRDTVKKVKKRVGSLMGDTPKHLK